MARIGCRHGSREILKSAESLRQAIRIELRNLQSPIAPVHSIPSGRGSAPAPEFRTKLPNLKSEMHHSPRFHIRIEFNGMVHRLPLRVSDGSARSSLRLFPLRGLGAKKIDRLMFHHSASSPPNPVRPRGSCQSRADTLDNVRTAPPLRGSAGRLQSDASRVGFLRIANHLTRQSGRRFCRETGGTHGMYHVNRPAESVTCRAYTGAESLRRLQRRHDMTCRPTFMEHS